MGRPAKSGRPDLLLSGGRSSPYRDKHAAKETTTVYTGVRNFSMLPEQLSTDTSSLLETEDKLGIVIEFIIGNDGSVHSSSVYRAILRNKAQLTYNAVGGWLEDNSGAPRAEER